MNFLSVICLKSLLCDVWDIALLKYIASLATNCYWHLAIRSSVTFMWNFYYILLTKWKVSHENKEIKIAFVDASFCTVLVCPATFCVSKFKPYMVVIHYVSFTITNITETFLELRKWPMHLYLTSLRYAFPFPYPAIAPWIRYNKDPIITCALPFTGWRRSGLQRW